MASSSVCTVTNTHNVTRSEERKKSVRIYILRMWWRRIKSKTVPLLVFLFLPLSPFRYRPRINIEMRLPLPSVRPCFSSYPVPLLLVLLINLHVLHLESQEDEEEEGASGERDTNTNANGNLFLAPVFEMRKFPISPLFLYSNDIIFLPHRLLLGYCQGGVCSLLFQLLPASLPPA